MKSKFFQPNYPDLNKCTIAIIGLGYVGLPLAIGFSKKQKSFISEEKLDRKVIGFDINHQRLDELKEGFDSTNEVSKQELLSTNFFDLTNKIESIAQADVFIITVPTPIDTFKKPNLEPLKRASITVAKALKIRAKSLNKTIPIVIYESTVYPGTTEEICIPIIEKESGLSTGFKPSGGFCIYNALFSATPCVGIEPTCPSLQDRPKTSTNQLCRYRA